MPAIHPHATLIRELFEAFRSADVDRVSTILADDVVWRFPGRKGQLAGEHRGRDGVLAFLGSVMQLTDGTFHLELENVVADDRHAIALFRGSGRREGKVLDNPTCLKISFAAGKVAEIWEFVWNLYEVDEFWA